MKSTVVFLLLVALVKGADLECFEIDLTGISSPQGLVGQDIAQTSTIISYGRESKDCRNVYGVHDMGGGTMTHTYAVGLDPKNSKFHILSHPVHGDHGGDLFGWIYNKGNRGTTLIYPSDANSTATVNAAMAQVVQEVWAKRNFINTLQFPNQTVTHIRVNGTSEIFNCANFVLSAAEGGGVVSIYSIETYHGVGLLHLSYKVVFPFGVVSFSGDQRPVPSLQFDNQHTPGLSNWEYLSQGADVLVGNSQHDNSTYGFNFISPPVYFLYNVHMNTTEFGGLSRRVGAKVAILTHNSPLVGAARGPGSTVDRTCDMNGDGVVNATDGLCPVTAAEYEALMRVQGYDGDVYVASQNLVRMQWLKLPVVSLSLINMKPDPPVDLGVLVDGVNSTINLPLLKELYGSSKYTIRADTGDNAGDIQVAHFTVEGVDDSKLQDGDGAAPWCISNEAGEDHENHTPRTGDCTKWNKWPTVEQDIVVRVRFGKTGADGKFRQGFPFSQRLHVIPFDE